MVLSTIVPLGASFAISSISSSGDGNTPLRPVSLGVRITHLRETILNAVDHDVSPRIAPSSFGPLFVLLVWIGNMKRQVKTAVLVSGIDDVGALRGFVVALPFFRTIRVSPQGYLVLL